MPSSIIDAKEKACLGGYSDVLGWLNARLAEVWKDRGAFPGLGGKIPGAERRHPQVYSVYKR